jgi:hypothetical protein
VFGNGAIFPTNEFNTTLSIGIPTFSSTTVTPISNNAGDMTALHIAATVFIYNYDKLSIDCR